MSERGMRPVVLASASGKAGANDKAGAHVFLHEDVPAAIDAHARAESPRECCGLLVGKAEGDRWHVQCAHRARNIADSDTRYLIDPRDHLTALRKARSQGLDVIGAYHSHPRSRPRPSPTDLAEALPEFLYLIASPTDKAAGSEVKAFRLDAQGFLELTIVVAPA